MTIQLMRSESRVLCSKMASIPNAGTMSPIRYTIAKCPLGHLLLAATEKGICRIGLADKPSSLERTIRSEFKSKNLRRDGARLDAWTGSLSDTWKVIILVSICLWTFMAPRFNGKSGELCSPFRMERPGRIARWPRQSNGPKLSAPSPERARPTQPRS